MAPAPRTLTFTVHVTVGVVIAPQSTSTKHLPPCTTLDVPLNITYGTGFSGTVALSESDSGGFTSATFTPPSVTGTRSVVMHLTRADDTTSASSAHAIVTATKGATTIASVSVPVTLDSPALNTPTSIGTPQALQNPTVTLTGSGLCPNSLVTFGNVHATDTHVNPTVHGTTLTVPVPRLATDGPITVLSAHGRSVATGAVHVNTYRNTFGFSFPNLPWGNDLHYWADAYGADQVWINGCWFIPGCHAPIEGIPSPDFAIFWGIASPILESGGASCFGFALASRHIARRETPSYIPRGSLPFAVAPGTGSAPVGLRLIWGDFGVQLSAEALRTFVYQSTLTITGNWHPADLRSQLESDFAAGDRPLLIMAQGLAGHAVNAYDIDPGPWAPIHWPGHPDPLPAWQAGDYRIMVYDNNVPFGTDENADADEHQRFEDGSSLIVHADGSWEFPNLGWSGTRLDPYPLEETKLLTPHSPLSLDGLVAFVVGSGHTTAGATDTTSMMRLPAMDAAKGAHIPDQFVAKSNKNVTLPVTPGSGGKTAFGFIGSGNLGSMQGHGAGSITVGRSGNALGWNPKGTGAVKITFGAKSGGTTHIAKLDVASSGGEAISMSGAGTITVKHSGDSTSAHLTLIDSKTGATFVSESFQLGSGTTAIHANWHALASTKALRIGHRTVRGAAGVKLTIAHAAVKRHGDKALTTFSSRLAGAGAGAKAFATVQLLEGRKVLSTASGRVKLRGSVANGKLTLKLPPGTTKRLRVRVTVGVITRTSQYTSATRIVRMSTRS